jgi:hypothetical protein
VKIGSPETLYLLGLGAISDAKPVSTFAEIALAQIPPEGRIE